MSGGTTGPDEPHIAKDEDAETEAVHRGSEERPGAMVVSAAHPDKPLEVCLVHRRHGTPWSGARNGRQ